jgi:hypothetical protein
MTHQQRHALHRVRRVLAQRGADRRQFEPPVVALAEQVIAGEQAEQPVCGLRIGADLRGDLGRGQRTIADRVRYAEPGGGLDSLGYYRTLGELQEGNRGGFSSRGGYHAVQHTRNGSIAA